jgi:hypothetical protein
VRSLEDAFDFARRCSFPGHGLVVRPSSVHDPRVFKDVVDDRYLKAAFEAALAQSGDGYVALEVDLRAHRNPTRRGVIAAAAADLAARLASACPACAAPGFGPARVERGLPCADCGTPTGETAADVHACVRCAHVEHRPRRPRTADPAHCPACNP